MPSPALEPVAYRPRPALQPMPGAGFAIPPRTMLLVEDSRLAAEAVRLVCLRIGIRLRRTDTLAGAALHLKVYRPDIVLIDLGLPDGSGLDLIAALARSAMRPRRLVAVSGDPAREGAALDAGADAFLQKPVSVTRHILALTGDDDLADADCLASPRVTGEGWARDTPVADDPVALRDDLRLAQDLLSGTDDPKRLRYAGQFLVSVGRSLRDASFADAAEAATAAGDRGSLVSLARARSRGTPLI